MNFNLLLQVRPSFLGLYKQEMVSGGRGDNSFSGVTLIRNPCSCGYPFTHAPVSNSNEAHQLVKIAPTKHTVNTAQKELGLHL